MISGKQIGYLLIFLCFSFSVEAQSLKKYPISNSGCSMYCYSVPEIGETEYSEDSSIIYKAYNIIDDYEYGVICIKLMSAMEDLETAEALGKNYCDFLKSVFDIVEYTGYGSGHKMNNYENAIGFIDYWKDKEGDEWKIKCWTNGAVIALMYVTHTGSLPSEDLNKQEAFLNGFRFADE